MSYVPKYCQETDVERLVQFDITASSNPSSSDVLAWIEEVEREIDARKLGWKDGGVYGDGYEMIDLLIDVPKQPEEEDLPKTQRQREEGDTVMKIYLTGYPILAMTSLYRRTTSPSKTPAWEQLTEGLGGDYLLITEEGKNGQRYGIGFYIFNKKPTYGKARLKASFTYSYNIPAEILREYVSLKVAIRVLETSVLSGEPTRLVGFTGGEFQTFVNTQLEVQLRRWKERIREIERLHFPDLPCGKISL